ncbi:hypothetical protein RND71_018566 [Anisodus tanguticus]|uniref:NB-ARC domain-containing protein n=1 Tax=Anisodus tanguticus TaxID=243964 RepID=A0AAE1VKC3_9SOLA|nr:hypothetical protein RND71_018566 [Anisodus tanguticus]
MSSSEGTGGVEKTTLVKNLNNELLKTDVSRSKLSFGIVVLFTDVRKVQAQIVNRLEVIVDNEESVESIASKIYQRLKQEKSLHLILDDVWEPINLDEVGVPQPEDSAGSKQRSKHVNENVKKRGDIQSCFLYCSLYPAAILTNDLIKCWWSEGFLGEHDTYEEAYNRGITMIESLKDACLIETRELNSVKMHDVVHDVSIWIANSFGTEHNSLIQAGIELAEISHIKMSASHKRISFVSNRINSLPDCFMECPETTSLLLQDNDPLVKTPHEHFLAFPALRVLNLSETGITALSSSINSLYQLRAVILKDCHWLTELPPIDNLCNLLLLDCANIMLHYVPHGMDKLTDLKLLHLPPTALESIGQGILLKLSSIEIINMMCTLSWRISRHPQFHQEQGTDNTLGIVRKKRVPLLGTTSFDELSSLHKLTSLSIKLDSSSIFNGDHTWMTRLKRFRIEVGEGPMRVPFNKSTRMIGISKCEIFMTTFGVALDLAHRGIPFGKNCFNGVSSRISSFS